MQYHRFYSILRKNNIKLDDDVYDTWDKVTWANWHLHENMRKYKENKAIVSDDSAWENRDAFYRNLLTNPKSVFYAEKPSYIPSAKDVSKIIKD